MYRSSVLVIPKNELTAKELDKIHEDLTFPNPEYENTLLYSKWKVSDSIPKTVSFYTQTATEIIIPRNYPLPAYEFEDRTVLGAPIVGMAFNGTLRDYQLEYFREINWRLNDLTFACGCGHGKTTLGINCIYKFKVKAVVFVNTNFLLRQWVKRMKQFTNITPYVLGSEKPGVFNIQGHDVIISTLDMFRSVTGRNRESVDSFTATGKYTGELSFINDIGLVLFDEAHRLGASEYEPVITAIPARHRITLSATLRRGDGREKMLKYHFGKIYTMPNQFPPAKYYGFDTGIEFGQIVDRTNADKMKLLPLLEQYNIDYQIYKDYYEVFCNYKQLKTIENDNPKDKYKRQLTVLRTPVKNSTLDTFILTVAKRQRKVYSLLDELAAQGRTILVLSKRKKVLKIMYDMYVKKGFECALVISETSNSKNEDELEAQMTKSRFIFGISQLAQEGMDCDNLDTVVTLHVIKDPEQLIGRVMRVKEGKQYSLAIQCVDRFRQYLGIYDKSITFAKNCSDIKGLVKYDTLLERI